METGGSMTDNRQVEIPLSLVMERQAARHRGWDYPRWRAVGVVIAGDADGGAIRRRKIHVDRDGVTQVLWSGLRLVLHRDAAESYWYNLVGRRPSLFVVCRGDVDGEMTPCAISADYDEAGAYMEADDTVYAVPLPPEIHLRLERHVLAHYRPTAPRKRRRTPWTQGGRNVSA
jgi:hypothetical protein